MWLAWQQAGGGWEPTIFSTDQVLYEAERFIDLDRRLTAEKQSSTEGVEEISHTELRLAVVIQDLAEGIEDISTSASRGRRMVSGVGLSVDVDMDDGSCAGCSGKEVSEVLLYRFKS